MISPNRGKLIVIEGIDGSGKGTQATLLQTYLNAHAIKNSSIDFPNYESFYGSMIAQFLRGEYGGIETTSPYLISLLYALDRRDEQPHIVQDLSEGKIVVANRYATSNMAHQGSKFKDAQQQEKYMKWVEKLEYEINRIPREDIVIYLKISVETSKKLTMAKTDRTYLNGKKKDIHEENDDHLSATTQAYQKLAQMYKHWVTIDCEQHGTIKPLEIIHAHILAALTEKGILVR